MMSTTKVAIQNSIEQARIDKWQEKQAQENPSFKYEQFITESENNKTINIKTDLDKKDITPQQRAEIHNATMCSMSGSANMDYGRMLLEQTLKGFFCAEDYAAIANAVNSALLAMAPADIIEGQLCARLLVLNSQISEYMGKAASSTQTSEGSDLNINRATKLGRLYNETLDALNRHKRGTQTLTVQNVNVNNGGQAIVTGQLNPGETNDKK